MKQRHAYLHEVVTKGSVALISVLIVVAVLFTVVITGAVSWVRERQASSASLNKKMAEGFASGCMEHAMQTLGQNANYLGNETYPMGNGVTCTIFPIGQGGGQWTLSAQVGVGGQWAKLQVVLTDRAPPAISSWSQVSILP